jgi:histidine ammonia-lyase
VEVELNGAGDNPLVLADDGVVLSNGNFHLAALALAFDLAGLALAQVASLAAQRARSSGTSITCSPSS